MCSDVKYINDKPSVLFEKLSNDSTDFISNLHILDRLLQGTTIEVY